MKKNKDAVDLAKIVEGYFTLIRSLRHGDASSVDKLMELWEGDGTFEFKGSPPVVGTFRGAMAIRTLYLNRLKGTGMALKLEGTNAPPRDVALGVVDTEVTSIRKDGNRVLAGWRTTIGTQQGQGFDVTGAHVFSFKGDKIKSLRVTISPKPVVSQLATLKLDALSVQNVGRLSLAAWPVV
jgi:ketosteroid isomerase-like protein